MDKRHLLEVIDFPKDNNIYKVNVYLKNSGYTLSCRICFGQVDMYVPKYYTRKDFDFLLNKSLNKYQGTNITVPYYKPDGYVYKLGRKRTLTTDPYFKENEKCFYYSKNASSPINKYKKDFLEYMKQRVLFVGKKMNLDLSNWNIRTGLFISYYGICFPTKKQLKFDYRLYAFKEEIIDSIIIHELCHIFEQSHSQRFYSLLKSFCPDYDLLQSYVNRSFFDGENGV